MEGHPGFGTSAIFCDFLLQSTQRPVVCVHLTSTSPVSCYACLWGVKVHLCDLAEKTSANSTSPLTQLSLLCHSNLLLCFNPEWLAASGWLWNCSAVYEPVNSSSQDSGGSSSTFLCNTSISRVPEAIPRPCSSSHLTEECASFFPRLIRPPPRWSSHVFFCLCL